MPAVSAVVGLLDGSVTDWGTESADFEISASVADAGGAVGVLAGAAASSLEEAAGAPVAAVGSVTAAAELVAVWVEGVATAAGFDAVAVLEADATVAVAFGEGAAAVPAAEGATLAAVI